MPYAFRCRRCKGPAVPEPPEGACKNCFGFYRHERVWVDGGEVDGAQMAPIRDGEVISLTDLMAGKDEPEMKKRPTGSPGVDHIFGGGLFSVGTILIAAKEGVGKTTWLWGLLHRMATVHKLTTLYVSSEQQALGLKAQLARLGLKDTKRFQVLVEHDAKVIYRAVEDNEPDIMVLDSLHHVTGVTDEEDYGIARGSPKAVTQVALDVGRRMAEIRALAFLVGHMNNDGDMKGGSDLRHTVDATLRLDRMTEDPKDPHRILSFEKVRLAPPGRQALLIMGDKGMEDHGPWEPPEEAPPGRVERPRGAERAAAEQVPVVLVPKGKKKGLPN